MQQLPMKAKLKMFMIVFLVCFVGILATSFMIDKKIDSYIADLKSDVNINIEIIDNNDSKVNVKQDGNDIKVYINPKSEESHVTKTTKVKPTYVTVTSELGLNIRKEPDISSEKVGAINYGDKIKITEDTGEWYKTDLGFIYKSYTN